MCPKTVQLSALTENYIYIDNLSNFYIFLREILEMTQRFVV